MATQTGEQRFDWRRAVGGGLAAGAVAAMLATGFGASTALAQPAQPTETESPSVPAGTRAPGQNCTGDDCSKPVAGQQQAESEPQKVSADQLLAEIYQQYRQGDGGGQVSKLIDDAMKLRAQGFRPSQENAEALADALDRRPHQTPLVQALRETIAYQRKQQAQAAMSQGGGGGPVPVILGPNAGISIPLG
ncbi:hypothetical protein [Mycolicibacterium sp. XJ1819]